jgi:hypothetical protein
MIECAYKPRLTPSATPITVWPLRHRTRRSGRNFLQHFTLFSLGRKKFGGSLAAFNRRNGYALHDNCDRCRCRSEHLREYGSFSRSGRCQRNCADDRSIGPRYRGKWRLRALAFPRQVGTLPSIHISPLGLADSVAGALSLKGARSRSSPVRFGVAPRLFVDDQFEARSAFRSAVRRPTQEFVASNLI